MVSTSVKLEKELNDELKNKIDESSILQKWIENQKKGYKHVAKHCFDLWSYLDAFELLNREETNNIVNQRPENSSKEIQKLLKTRMF